MTRNQKEKDIEKKVRVLIKDSTEHMRKNIRRALDSGAIDINKHEGDYIIPKVIFLALLKEESFQYHKEKKKYNREIENVYYMM